MQSRYCYQGTDILINKFDIRDNELLDKVEREITAINQLKLEAEPIKGDFDLKHLQQIHKFIFGDIYDFAGTIRSENISKGFVFANAQFIEGAASDLFKKLKKENFLIGKNMNEFSERAAYYMAEINVLHPFREGNGRSTREFIRELAYKCGFELNWSKVDKEILFFASVKSVIDTKELSNAIRDCIDDSSKELNNNITKMLERDTKAYNAYMNVSDNIIKTNKNIERDLGD